MMFHDIDPKSPTPLYEQIAARVRVAIASGELSSGDTLPSMRQLARQLRVNPATVVQAYRDLAIDGFVETRHGQGTFVLEVPGHVRDEERRARALELVRKLLQDAARLGIGAEELVQALEIETEVEARGSLSEAPPLAPPPARGRRTARSSP